MSSVNPDPIRRGDDWEWVHTVALENGGTILGSRISMTWKYDLADADSAAAAKVTSDTLDSSPGGGITIIDDTSFSVRVPSSATKLIEPGALYVDIQYELPNGRVKTEQGLNRATKCLPDVTRDTAT